MKKNCRKFAWLLMIVVCLVPVCAQAALDLSSYENFKAQAAAMGRNFSTCEEGDSGSNVLAVKKRLQELGYYRETATFDDDFNDTMEQRVKLFQENNSLDVNGYVDQSTVEALKGINPIRGEYFEGYWSEPDVTMIIPDTTWGKWNEKSGDRFTFAIKTKNVSTSKRIVATEFLVYTEDIWGDQIISKSRPYSYTIESAYKPGEMKYTGYMEIPYRSDTHKVHIAINKVRYSDGSIGKVSSPVYCYWNIKW